MRPFSSYAYCCLALMGLLEVSIPARGEEPPPLKVGWVVNLSGPASTFGLGADQGVRLAVDEVNADNLAGRKIELITVDDATDPRTAADVCSRLALQDKVDVIVGEQITPARVACNQAIQRAGLVYVNAAGTAGDVCPANMFTFGQVPNQFILPLTDFMLNHGGKRIYLLGSDYSSNKGVFAMMEKRIAQHGAAVAGTSLVPLGTTDFAVAIGQAVSTKPDFIFGSVIGADGVTFQKQFKNDPRAAGIKRADITISPATAKALGKDAEGVYVATSYLPGISNPKAKVFNKAIADKFGAKADPDFWAMQAYDAVLTLANVIKAVGADSKAMSAAFAKASFEGPSGLVKLVNNFAAMPTFIGLAQADGTIKVVEELGAIDPQLSCAAK
jgi:branched-chain amino acid transport system substrate-binding protein